MNLSKNAIKPDYNSEEDPMDLDLKIVRGFALAYFLYGIIYWLEIGKFLVPLPMVYYFVPAVGIIMFVRSIKWKGSVLFLLIPTLILKDLTINVWPILTSSVMAVTVILWLVWSVVTFVHSARKIGEWIFLVSQISLLSLLFIEARLSGMVISLILVGVSVFYRQNSDNLVKLYDLRLALLIQFLTVLYLLQILSLWSVS
ncbi:MAG: hypothetical protein H6600_07455 [Flavobacteriales bacterium]|nr:hypothetical protein [Flavobacteriales bacterium]MCB9198278.1 hypothetical protein [Flavobacteriales bacterium]